MKEFEGPCIAVDEVVGVYPDGADRIMIVRRIGSRYDRATYRLHDVVKALNLAVPILGSMMHCQQPAAPPIPFQ